MNTLQIKAAPGAGLAVLGPPPPKILKEGLSEYKNFLAHTKSSQKETSKEEKLPLLSAGKDKDPPPCGAGAASGTQILIRYPAHADLINKIAWESPGGVAYYKIYRDSLSSLIGTTPQCYYDDHQRVPRKAVTYLITSVDSNGQESAPMTIFVAPL